MKYRNKAFWRVDSETGTETDHGDANDIIDD